jgi:hypothetical protein
MVSGVSLKRYANSWTSTITYPMGNRKYDWSIRP